MLKCPTMKRILSLSLSLLQCLYCTVLYCTVVGTYTKNIGRGRGGRGKGRGGRSLFYLPVIHFQEGVTGTCIQTDIHLYLYRPLHSIPSVLVQKLGSSHSQRDIITYTVRFIYIYTHTCLCLCLCLPVYITYDTLLLTAINTGPAKSFVKGLTRGSSFFYTVTTTTLRGI